MGNNCMQANKATTVLFPGCFAVGKQKARVQKIITFLTLSTHRKV